MSLTRRWQQTDASQAGLAGQDRAIRQVTLR
jgi:hypothetical protein